VEAVSLTRHAVLLLGATALVASCGDDGDEPPRRDATGCPVAVDYVAELLEYEVDVLEEGASELACRYEPVDGAERPGSHVLIVERSVVDDGGYEAVRSGIEAEASTVETLDEEAIADLGEGAERGWVAEVGRAVQVGVSTGEALFQVTVADAERSADDAREVALVLASEAIR
jgi:hypothetical protein